MIYHDSDRIKPHSSPFALLRFARLLDLQRLILRSKPVVPGPPGPIISHSVIFLLAVPASNNFPGLITRLRFVPEHVGDRNGEDRP